MRLTLPVFIIICLLFTLTAPQPATAWDMDVGMELMEDFRAEYNYSVDDTLAIPTQSDAVYNILSIYPSFIMRAGPSLKAYFLGDITWIADIKESDGDDTEMAAANAFVHWRSTHLSLRAGLIPLVSGRHYLFSNEETGVEMIINPTPRHYFTLQAADIYEHSPFAAAWRVK